MAISESEKSELKGYLPSAIASSDRLEALIRGAEFRVSRKYFGKAFVYALSLMVAHKATLEEMAADGVSGPVTEKREGDISVSYGSGGNGKNSELNATVYGQEYLSLLAQYKPDPHITMGLRIGGLDGGHGIQSLF